MVLPELQNPRVVSIHWKGNVAPQSKESDRLSTIPPIRTKEVGKGTVCGWVCDFRLVHQKAKRRRFPDFPFGTSIMQFAQ